MPGERFDERSLAAWRRAYAEGISAPGPCPGEAALAALATGELEREERARIADHVVACRRCAADYRTLRDLHRQATLDAGGDAGSAAVSHPLSPPRRRRRFALALAAGVALAVGATFFWRLAPAPPARSGGVPALVSSPQDRTRLPAAPSRFAWSAQPDADAYRVELYDADSTLIWESGELERPAADVPAAVAAGLERGRTYYWRVLTRRGIVVEPLPLLEFSIEP